MLECYSHATGEEMARAVLLAGRTGTKTGTAANRAVKTDESRNPQTCCGI
jgi:hypothetical protein